MLKFNNKSIHWKIASFFWYWSLWRDESYSRHSNLCNHFWWTVCSWLMPIVTAFLAFAGTVFGFYALAGLGLHSLYGIFLHVPELLPGGTDGELVKGAITSGFAEVLGYCGLVFQCIIWRVVWMAWRDSKHKDFSFFPAMVGAAYTGMKDNFCPLIQWKD